ncbi:MAG: hypothetical protein ACAH80_02205 [Alphaproteobacteria bacterium]
MDNNDKGIAAVTAAILHRGRMLNYVSLVLSALVVAQFLSKGAAFGVCPSLVLALGLAEFWFAARVALDANLFEKIADGKLSTKDIDDSLLRLGLIKQEKAGRSMEDRSRGAFRLLKLQGMCLLGQMAAFIAGAIF